MSAQLIQIYGLSPLQVKRVVEAGLAISYGPDNVQVYNDLQITQNLMNLLAQPEIEQECLGPFRISYNLPNLE